MGGLNSENLMYETLLLMNIIIISRMLNFPPNPHLINRVHMQEIIQGMMAIGDIIFLNTYCETIVKVVSMRFCNRAFPLHMNSKWSIRNVITMYTG